MSVNDYSNELVCIDTESSDLDPRDGARLLEVSVARVMPAGLSQIRTWLVLVNVDAVKLACPQKVVEMHEANGLWKALEDANVTHVDHGERHPLAAKSLERIDAEICDWLDTLGLKNTQELPIKQRPRILGRKPSHDMGFLRRYLPWLFARLSYREVDLVGIEHLFRSVLGEESRPQCADRRLHRSAADVEDAIEAWHHYQSILGNKVLASKTKSLENQSIPELTKLDVITDPKR